MAIAEYERYHATLKENAIEITNTQTFKYDKHTTNKKLLGGGIYFYTERIHAVDWTIKMYRDDNGKLPDNSLVIINNYRIVTADLLTDESRILDLDSREEINKINLMANMVTNHLKQYSNCYQDKSLAILLNYLKKKNFLDNIDIVQKTFTFPVKTNKYLKGVNFIHKKVICVKNNSIIKNANISRKISLKEYNNSISIFREGGE